MAIIDNVTKRQQQMLDELIEFVNAIGVPNERIKAIQEIIQIKDPFKLKQNEPCQIAKNTISALHSFQAYSKCYPYIDSCELILKCANVWEAVSARTHASRQVIIRKLTMLKMDPKADTEWIQHLKGLKADFDKACTVVNVGLYRIRVLKTLHLNKKKKMGESTTDE